MMKLLIILLSIDIYCVQVNAYTWQQILYSPGDISLFPSFLNASSAEHDDNFEQHSKFVTLHGKQGNIISYNLFNQVTNTFLDHNLGVALPFTLAYLGEQDALWVADYDGLLWRGSPGKDSTHSWEAAWLGPTPPWFPEKITCLVPVIADGAIALFMGGTNGKLFTYDPFQKILLQAVDLPTAENVRGIYTTDTFQPAVGAVGQMLVITTDNLIFYYPQRGEASNVFQVSGRPMQLIFYKNQLYNFAICNVNDYQAGVGRVLLIDLSGNSQILYEKVFSSFVKAAVLGVNNLFQDVLYVGIDNGDVWQFDLAFFVAHSGEVTDKSWKLLTDSFGPLNNSPVSSLLFNFVQTTNATKSAPTAPILVVGRDNGMISARVGSNDYWQLLATSDLTEFGNVPTITDLMVVCTNYHSDFSIDSIERRLLARNKYSEAYVMSGPNQLWTFAVEAYSLSSMKFTKRLKSSVGVPNTLGLPPYGNIGVISFFGLKAFINVNLQLTLVFRASGADDKQVSLLGYIENSQQERTDLQKVIVQWSENSVAEISYIQLFSYVDEDSLITWEWYDTLYLLN